MKIEPAAFACESTIKLLKELGPTAHVWPLIRATTSKDWNCEFPLYTEAQLRQLGEACAASCDAIAKGRNSVVGTRCADSVRRLIKEMLPAAELAKQEVQP